MFDKTLRISAPPKDSAKVAMSCDIGEGRWVDMTYGEFREIVEEVMKCLANLGVKKGDRIPIVGENHFKWLPVFIGITGYGAIAVPVDGASADQRLLAIVEDCSPSVVVVTTKIKGRWEALYERLPGDFPLVDFHFEILKMKTRPEPLAKPPAAPEPKDAAAIIYTSGTTGKPKGIVLSHSAIMSSIRLGVRSGSFGPHDAMLAILPLSHVFGLINAGLAPIVTGGRVILAGSYIPGGILGAAIKYHLTFALLVPRLAEVFVMALRQAQIKVPTLTIIIGGAAVAPSLLEAFRRWGIRTMQGFGMTETAGGVIMCDNGPLGSIGKPFPEVETKIKDPNPEGVGELLIKSPTLMTGIWGSPDQTKEAFDADFLRTGDLAHIDEAGYVYIRGRAKDVIVPAGGMNVYPDELELRLGHLPFAEEYSILGLQEGGYEFPALVFRPKKEFFAEQQETPAVASIQDELDRLTAGWPEWERFRRVIMLETPLPRSSSFKVKRNSLVESLGLKASEEQTSMAAVSAAQSSVRAAVSRAQPSVHAASEGSSALPKEASPAPDTEDQEIFDKFKSVVAHFLNVPSDQITPGKRLVEFLQLDSLGIIALISHLEEVFGLSLKQLIGRQVRDFGGLFALIKEGGYLDKLKGIEIPTNDAPALPPLLDYSREAVKMRQQFLQKHVVGNIKGIPRPDDPLPFAGNIEGFFGFSQVPLGLVGPLRIIGEFANGDYYVPLATTEGALVSSICRGAQVITMSGGARVKVLADSLVRAPLFMFRGIPEMLAFSDWIPKIFSALKEVAESTTRFGKLNAVEQFPMGSNLCLRFVYATGDASGQNMTTIATHKAVEYILREFKGQISDWFLETNLSGDKKINAINFTRNRGKRVIAEVGIPDDLVEKLLHTTSDRMVKLSSVSQMSALHAHSFGCQAHYANVLAAIFIACGQDPACVAESATGVTQLEKRDGHLVASVTMPGIMIGTVGGGTRLPTQQLCLQILDCDGPRKARKMGEIVAGAVLAGEISLIAAMAADEFADAHARYGRQAGMEAPARK